jgi:hypothetical protein
MSLIHPSRTARRLIKLASLGLAGLIAGLFTGCTSVNNKVTSSNDTDWQIPSSYASATATISPRNAERTPHMHMCYGAPCTTPHAAVERTSTRSLRGAM